MHHTYQYHINACSLTSRFCWWRAPRASCDCLICTGGNVECVMRRLCRSCKCFILFYCLSFIILWWCILLLFIIITHHEITISTGVLVIDLVVNLPIQPTTVLDRLKEGRYLRLKGGVMDRGEWGDQDALGLRFVRWLEGKICTIYCFWFCYKRGVHFGIIIQQ